MLNQRSILTVAIAAAVTAVVHNIVHVAAAEPTYHGTAPMSIAGPTVVQIPLTGAKSTLDKRTDLDVTATYPVDGGPYPLIVFSHGYGGDPPGYHRLTNYWAAHGYVVLEPTHADAGALKLGEPIKEMSKSLSDPAACRQRVADMENILDSLPLIEHEIPSLKGKIDKSRIAAAGHSFGAYTTQLLGGATVSFPGDTPNESFADHRLACVLMLSPQGANKMGLTPTSWNNMTGPAMTMTGSKDFPFGQSGGPDTRLDPYKNAPPGNKYLVYIDGANHFTFCDLDVAMEEKHPMLLRRHQRQGMSQTDMFDYVKAASLAFFDTYLKHDAKAHAYLTSPSIMMSSNDVVHVSAK